MKRQIRVPGEKTELVCEHCQAVRTATWNYDDYKLDDGTIVTGVMVAKCDTCGDQAGLAAQSAYLLREAREKKREPRLRTTVTLSRPLRDLAEARLHQAGKNSMNAVEAVVLSVLSSLRRSRELNDRLLTRLREAADDPLLKQCAFDVRVSLRLSKAAEEAVGSLLAAESLNRSEFVRRAILLEDKELEESLKNYALC